MKPPAVDPLAAKGPDRWVEDGLRALREQVPSDQSRRATLARLGLASEPSVVDRRGDRSLRVPPLTGPARSALRWWLAGIALGLVLVLVKRWLGS